MGDKNAGRNFPKARGDSPQRENEGRYNTSRYYAPNRRLGDSRDERPQWDHDVQYDDLNTGKQENYRVEGHYGSRYGSINELNRGRDAESNAGYRNNYAHLTTGQWPEVREAAERRGIDLRWRELEARGAHRGKGPRSYQRSDFRLSEDIYDVLLEDRYIDASDIEIAVEKGEVILTGTVENRHIKRRVEDVIEEQVSGIRHLENRLRVKQPGAPVVNVRRSDEA